MNERIIKIKEGNIRRVGIRFFDLNLMRTHRLDALVQGENNDEKIYCVAIGINDRGLNAQAKLLENIDQQKFRVDADYKGTVYKTAEQIFGLVS